MIKVAIVASALWLIGVISLVWVGATAHPRWSKPNNPWLTVSWYCFSAITGALIGLALGVFTI